MDPWPEFVAASERSDCAGYFERGLAPGLAGRWAASFTEPDDTWTLHPRDTPEDLDARTRRQLRGDAGRTLIGYVGFDATSMFEPLVARAPRGSPFPLGEWALVPRLRFRRVERPGSPNRHVSHGELPTPLVDTLPRVQFERSVGKLREAVGAGEAFQVVLSHRRTWHRPEDLLDRLTLLRARERFAYFYYLKFGDREILGASPESVLETQNHRAYLSPIAATRPRRRSGGRAALHRDPKELAEHRMLVDLARNDLGRVSVPGRVRLVWEERLERFARLEHLISRVEGTLPPSVGPWSALAATFPAGTVSGAPKIRATHLLRREERTWRGPYAGAVGLIRGNGDAAWALAIRGAFIHRDRLHTAAGAGIVWHSQPPREFHETLLKLEELETTLVGSRP
ncbi:MAG: chorismate-binding protein [Thermoplasmata archaeon]|nr:chorismate-binding protein [Thermoplasmata archaeon]